MTKEGIVALCAAGAVLLILFYDAIALAHEKPSLSESIESLAREYPVIPFILGLLAGHLFWAIKPVAPRGWQ